MSKENVPVFETQNVDLASFFILEEVKFIGCKRDPHQPHIVILQFADPRGICLDLERVFLSSQFKQYRDINKWLLQQIHKTLKS